MMLQILSIVIDFNNNDAVKGEQNMNIKKILIDSAEKLEISNNVIGYSYNEKLPYMQISYDNEGFFVKFTVFEKDPLREHTNHFSKVHMDSCVEFFVNFTPQYADRYINFEANANGAMNASFRKNRYEKKDLRIDEIESLNISPKIYSDYWTLEYKIGFDLIKKYYPQFDISKKEAIKCNIYKCCENSTPQHFLMYFNIPIPEADFHLPEYFGSLEIE